MVTDLNGHDFSNFEATTSIFCMLIDLNDTYGLTMIMMLMIIMIMMMLMMMKTQNSHNSANFEAITSRFCINDTCGLYFQA